MVDNWDDKRIEIINYSKDIYNYLENAGENRLTGIFGDIAV